MRRRDNTSKVVSNLVSCGMIGARERINLLKMMRELTKTYASARSKDLVVSYMPIRMDFDLDTQV